MAIVTLSAQSIGYLAARRLPQNAQVHSCFAHALNLIADDGHLFTLLDAKCYQNLPDAVRITLPEGWDWQLQASTGESVQLVPGNIQSQRWRVYISDSELWQPRLNRSSLCLDTLPLALQHYETLASQLLLYCLEHQVESDLRWASSPVSKNESKRQLELEEQPEQLENQIVKLLGYGKGLTPDGDDYLVGYLAALSPWQLTPELLAHQNRMQQLIKQHLPHTTDISRHYLSRALEGHFSQPVCTLQEKIISSTQNATIIDAAEQIMQFGASSGVDCLAGMLHGLRSLKAAL
jgi:hypothetical protein